MTKYIDPKEFTAAAIKRLGSKKSRLPKRELEMAAYRVCCDRFGEEAVGVFGDYLPKPAGYWNFELIQAEALKYETRIAFQKGSSAYQAALRLGIMEQVCAHMKPVRQSWTPELIQAEALKYQTRSAFGKGSGGAYTAAWRLGILEQVCSHMQAVLQSWTPERIQAEALKYETRTAFAKGSKGAYAAASRLGILEQVCSHMPKNAKRRSNKQ